MTQNQQSFHGFFSGPENQALLDLLESVCTAPGAEGHGLLYLHGSKGVGKTHLLRAAAAGIRQTHPDAAVLYIKAEEFFSALVQASRNGTRAELDRRYAAVDVLLIDDIQFVAEVEVVRKALSFHIRNMYAQHRQVIITGNCPLCGLPFPVLADHAVSMAVLPPDRDARLRIIRRTCDEMGESLDTAPADRIADTFRDDMNHLVGMLKRLFALRLLRGAMTTEEILEEIASAC